MSRNIALQFVTYSTLFRHQLRVLRHAGAMQHSRTANLPSAPGREPASRRVISVVGVELVGPGGQVVTDFAICKRAHLS